VKMRKAAIVLLLATTLPACGFLSRTKSAFYSIEPLPGTVTAIQGVPIAVDIVELPPGFDRKEIVVRQADGKLEIRETQQWTALLEPSVLHAVAFNLASRLPEGMVILPGQAVPAGGTRPIDLMFEEIVAGPGNEVVIDVRWTMRGGTTHHERIVTPIGSLESGEIANGMSRGLATLAERIVAGLG
jgi:uncharacterized lipoprotein YmbA